jgi:UDP-N-acetylmuramoyl-tripeptide--D-alanyl-D-alanine ligase
MRLTMGEVAEFLGASGGTAERMIEGYSTDSRSIVPGELFFALRGPRFDGHQFVQQALARGAVGAVVERPFHELAAPSVAPFLLPVPNTLEALQTLARVVRRKWGHRLIAITGSVGKSTTKEMLAALLATRWSVLKSPGNLNNDYGVPLALLALEPTHGVAVVELAMSGAGEIARLAQIAEPDVGLVTNVAPAHLEFFDSLDAIARAKRELIDNLSSRREAPTAILNYDDPRVRRFAEGFAGRVVTYGFEGNADFRAIEVRAGQEGGSEFRFVGPNWDAEFRLPLPGRHNVQNALAALTVATLFEVAEQDLRLALAGFQNLHQRGETMFLPGGITVINDSYNSNPLAMERMLETLASWPHAGQRIVVAGEMLELGSTSPALHKDIGRQCARSDVAWLIAVQGDARFFVAGALEEGFPPERTRWFPQAQEAGEFCLALLRPGDVVLVKGSRAVHMEKVVELLRSSRPTAATPRRELGAEV